MNTFSKHSAHSVSFIECVVASNKVMSARKKICSTHVEKPKVERFRMREGRKQRACKAEDPQLGHEVNVLVYFYLVYT